MRSRQHRVAPVAVSGKFADPICPLMVGELLTSSRAQRLHRVRAVFPWTSFDPTSRPKHRNSAAQET